MKRKLAGIAALAAFFVLAWGGVRHLRAQMAGGSGQGAAMNRPSAPMTGSGAAMVVYDRYLYVISGPTLFKVDPATMKVEATLALGARGAAQDRLRAPTEGE